MRKVGIYVDASNIGMNGGHGMRYDVLRELACRAGGDPQRLNAYVAYDEERAASDPIYRSKMYGYHTALRDQGFRLTIKKVKRYRDENGEESRKSNVDLDMAVDLLTESDRLDSVLIGTGDGDFVNVVKALQTRGVRVEVVAFDNVSAELKTAADQFIPGWMIPDLVPTAGQSRESTWGAIGARARGYCSHFDALRGFGFLQYYTRLPDTRIITRDLLTSAWFHVSDIADPELPSRLPNRNLFLEFELAPAREEEKEPIAKAIVAVGG
jgi:uncharacterized LabA/DUF88 family protein